MVAVGVGLSGTARSSVRTDDFSQGVAYAVSRIAEGAEPAEVWSHSGCELKQIIGDDLFVVKRELKAWAA